MNDLLCQHGRLLIDDLLFPPHVFIFWILLRGTHVRSITPQKSLCAQGRSFCSRCRCTEGLSSPVRLVRACFYFSQLSASGWPRWEGPTKVSLRPCKYMLFYAKLWWILHVSTQNINKDTVIVFRNIRWLTTESSVYLVNHFCLSYLSYFPLVQVVVHKNWWFAKEWSRKSIADLSCLLLCLCINAVNMLICCFSICCFLQGKALGFSIWWGDKVHLCKVLWISAASEGEQ